MELEDDIQPLIQYETTTTDRELYLELNVQFLHTDVELEQVVYGYRRSRWRMILTYIFSTVLCGIPILVFHWYPTWFLYVTSIRCSFQIADCVLVVETYQKKCKSYYIHKIILKNITDASGLLNQGFIDEGDSEKEPIESVDAIHTPIHLDDGSTLNVQNYRYFRHKKQSLIWDGARAQWFRLGGIECGATCAQLHATGATPPSSERRVRMLNIYGLNEINVPVQSIMTLILLEVFNPFYVFQLFTIAVWLAEPYYYYCIAVVLMSTFGVATSVIQTKKNQSNLRATVEAHDTVELWDGRRVDSRMVAPGDVIVLPNRCTLHFDAALLNGSAVLNESMLTGESVPVTKTALLRVDRPFSMREHASSILFCGTRVIQTRYYNNEPVRALVLRTGYNTSKGQLVRSILYPVPADFKFDRDSYKFIIILACIAMLGLAYTVALKAYRALSPGDIAIKALDIITIVIPPALPAAMTVGRLYAVSRLKRARVACLNTRAVNVSGSIDCVCFDKTGTLTEDGLDMWGVVPVSGATRPARLGRPQRDPRQLNELHPLKLAMATCHSLTLLDAELAGDPLDLKMFESTGWVLEEPDVPESSNYEILTPTIVKPKKTANIDVDDIHLPLEVGIVQQHQFVSSLQRASVVTRVLGEDVLRVYCKGAPEMLKTLCTPDTVPDNLYEVLNSYAEKGYRVIACATRVLEVTTKQLQKMNREEVECDLEFLGLVIMENRLKGATTGIIRELKDANIHVVMITGDNILTAVSVAKECGILMSDERVVHLVADMEGKTPVIHCESTLHGAPVGRRQTLSRSWSEDSGRGSWRESGSGRARDVERGGDARYKVVMTGDTWKVLRDHYPNMLARVVARGAVFARMTSDQKQQLIVEYQALGYYVGMCGDGANDCGALRAAHTGISLSELESSVAAPFTSANPDIVCVSRVLREGRAALSTSFGVFKFMIFTDKTKEMLLGSSFKDAALSTVEKIFSLNELNIDSEVDLINAAALYASAQDEKLVQTSNGAGSNSVTHEGDTSDTVNKQQIRSVVKLVNHIRFLTLTPQQYTDCTARSSLLTPSEDVAVLVNIVSNKPSVPMPSELSTSRVCRKKDDKARSEATFRYTVQNFSRLMNEVVSPVFYVRNLPWQIKLLPRILPSWNYELLKFLSYHVICNAESESSSWSCNAVVELSLICHRPSAEPRVSKFRRLYNSKDYDWGHVYFLPWDTVLNPTQGYIQDDAITLEVHVAAEEPQGNI